MPSAKGIKDKSCLRFAWMNCLGPKQCGHVRKKWQAGSCTPFCKASSKKVWVKTYFLCWFSHCK